MSKSKLSELLLFTILVFLILIKSIIAYNVNGIFFIICFVIAIFYFPLGFLTLKNEGYKSFASISIGFALSLTILGICFTLLSQYGGREILMISLPCLLITASIIFIRNLTRNKIFEVMFVRLVAYITVGTTILLTSMILK